MSSFWYLTLRTKDFSSSLKNEMATGLPKESLLDGRNTR